MENSIKDILTSSLDQVRSVMDANTVVGQPIYSANGTIIYPVSKVSVGMATGGLDIPAKTDKSKNFGGGGGTGVSVSPIGFLTVYANGAVEMIPLAPTQNSPIEQVADIIDHTPDIISRIKDIFAPKKSAEQEAEAILAAAAVAQAEMEEAKRKKAEEEAAAAKAAAEAAANAQPMTKKEAKKLAKMQKKEAKKNN